MDKKKTRKKVTRKKTTRKKTSRKKAAPKQEELAPQEAAPVAEVEQPVVPAGPPTRWVMNRDMSFGIGDVFFARGSIFVVNWDERIMLCEQTGRTYDNIRDLEIAINNNYADPILSDSEHQQVYEQREQMNIEQKRAVQQKHDQRNEDARSNIIQSDDDLIERIDISHTKHASRIPKAPGKATPAPSNYVTAMKPRINTPMEIHQSDGVQEGTRIVIPGQRQAAPVAPAVPMVRPHVTGAAPIAPTIKKDPGFDAITGDGKLRSEIRRNEVNYDITVDVNGQQTIRGMQVLRDDSGAPGGYSRNEGTVNTFTPEELAARTATARATAESRKQQVYNALLPVEATPQTIVGDMSLIQDLDQPAPQPTVEAAPVSDKVNRLLRRRR